MKSEYKGQYPASEVFEIHKRAFRRGLLIGILSTVGVNLLILFSYLIWIGTQLPH